MVRDTRHHVRWGVLERPGSQKGWMLLTRLKHFFVHHSNRLITAEGGTTMAQQILLNVAQCTNVGRKRKVNEDSMISIVPEDPQVMAKKGALFVVADGLGGRAAGDIASEMAVSAMRTTYYRNEDEDVAASLLQAVQRANALIYQRATENAVWNGMGTTCVAAVLQGGIAYIANGGDSRAYIARDGHIKPVLHEHCWGAEHVRVSSLTAEAAHTPSPTELLYRF